MSATLGANADWLGQKGLQSLLAALGKDGEEARIAGGAVRNALLGEPVADIDIATTCLPDEVIRRAAARGLKVFPTGIAHGTVTVVSDGRPYEVTTLREDVETDGRRARVVFGRDWKSDAMRRDFTINGLYAEADGTVVDFVGGIEDIRGRRLRFIGDPDQRIREDYLRILRFFRFFAWYGHGRPDADGLKACARLKGGLGGLSAERVWAELGRMLSAPDPWRALLWMRQTGVLGCILPETEKWGIDAIRPLVAAEAAEGWSPDPMTRLIAIVPPEPERAAALAGRLRLSNAQARRLRDWAEAPVPDPRLSENDLLKLLYRRGTSGIVDRLKLGLALAGDMTVANRLRRLLEKANAWQRPKLPVAGRDLAGLGMAAGAGMGRLLARLEDEWIESGFAADRTQLLARAERLIGQDRN